ncbi:MAG: 2-isopropylmalate synthase [Alphaproteobacteria bacterium]|nr:2-isopropylmalate synthase [Alphaproteobacteria bacterium]
MTNQPIFYDTTLRDGNQALKRPWNHNEKEIIFRQLLALGIKVIEVGFPASGEMDFNTCSSLAQQAPQDVTVSVLARATKHDIEQAALAVQHASKPRIHTFIAMNPLGLEHVLQKDIETVTDIAVNAVRYAKSLLPANGEVEFSVEHFGDCRENLPAVLDAIEKVVEAGADVINLPNTVERFRPMDFIRMVEKVHERIGDKAQISVHCHNDLGMATATTVESFFAGATQLETTLNGIGERCGNTNMYEVAVALYNSDIHVPLRMNKFYETAQLVSQMANIPIWEKAPLMGSDSLAHRSGIHQNGANKTKGLKKGQYIAFSPDLIGRYDGEHIGFTGQSGKSALFDVFQKSGYPFTMEEAVKFLPAAKKLADEKGELTLSDLDRFYRTEVCHVTGPFELDSFERISQGKYALSFYKDGRFCEVIGRGSGPIESCVTALASLGVAIAIVKYEQQMLNDKEQESAEAVTMMNIRQNDKEVVARAINRSTTRSNIHAIFNGLNLLQK